MTTPRKSIGKKIVRTTPQRRSMAKRGGRAIKVGLRRIRRQRH